MYIYVWLTYRKGPEEHIPNNQLRLPMGKGMELKEAAR
jgi:hypothetical protein